MLTFVSAAIALMTLLWMVKARPAAILAGLLIFFSLSYRVIDIIYLDLFGPVYATELTRFVGGNSASFFFVASFMCVAIPFSFVLRDSSILADIPAPLPASGYLEAASRLGFAAVFILIAALYLDMLRIGTIPLFTGMDRLEYDGIAGLLHKPVYNLGFIPAAALGILTVVPRLQGRFYNVFAIALFIALLAYWAFTGNRFSAFLLATTFYALPFACVVALQRSGTLRAHGQLDIWTTLISTRVIVPLVAFFATVAVIGLLINSYYDVRNYADPTLELSQRIFVQPVEMFAAQWELVRLDQNETFNERAIDEVLFNPVDPSGNTTMRYLMVRELGYFRTVELIDQGNQLAGGYPEILIEIFGVYAAMLVCLLIGSTTALGARVVLRHIMHGRIGSAVMGVYVYYTLVLIYVGGMLNSLIAVTLLIKVLALVLIYWIERSILGGPTRSSPRNRPAGFARGRG